LKRGIAVIAGWAIMALMGYLIWVTARTVPKIWNPYDILGISDVGVLSLVLESWANI
jgi:translocation protein SEC63